MSPVIFKFHNYIQTWFLNSLECVGFNNMKKLQNLVLWPEKYTILDHFSWGRNLDEVVSISICFYFSSYNIFTLKKYTVYDKNQKITNQLRQIKEAFRNFIIYF
jgi:hypothetical protein